MDKDVRIELYLAKNTNEEWLEINFDKYIHAGSYTLPMQYHWMKGLERLATRNEVVKRYNEEVAKTGYPECAFRVNDVASLYIEGEEVEHAIYLGGGSWLNTKETI